MSSNLYDLSTQLQRVNEAIVNDEGVISEDLEVMLNDLLPQIQDKAGNIGKWIRNIEGSTLGIDAEIERLRKRKATIEHLEARLKEYLKDCMEKAGLTKLDTGIMVVSVQKNPPSVNIFCESAIPAEYKDIIPEQYVTSKKRILEALKAEITVAGAELKQGSHLRIR